MQRREERSSSSEERQPATTTELCVCRTNLNWCVWVCVRVCVYVCVVVFVCLPEKKTCFHLFISCEKRKDSFLERARGIASRSFFESRDTKGLMTKRTGQRRGLLRNDKISVRMQGLLWCCAAARAAVCSCRRLHAPSSASTVLFITTCASVKKKKDTMNH